MQKSTDVKTSLGVDLNKRLLVAAARGSVTHIEALLSKGVLIDIRDEEGNTPLMLAVINGHKDAIALLLQHGANIDLTNHKGRTALILSALNDMSEASLLLIKGGANVDRCDKHGMTAFMAAHRNDSDEIQSLLKAAHANLCLENRTELLSKAILAQDLNLVKEWILLGADMPFNQLLDMVTELHDASLLNYLIEHGLLELNQLNYPIILRNQLSFGSASMITTLFTKGIRLNNLRFGSDDKSALMVAAMAGNVEAVEVLLSHGADIDQQDVEGRTVLMLVVPFGHFAVIEALLKAHPSLNIHSHNGKTALMWAVTYGDEQATATLLDAGANKNYAPPMGETAVAIAERQGYDNLVALFRMHGTFQYRLKKINYKGEIPAEFVCPISFELMNDPVTSHESGMTYDRQSLIQFFEARGNPQTVPCPQTRTPIDRGILRQPTTIVLKQIIERFVKDKEQQAAADGSITRRVIVLSAQGLFRSSSIDAEDRELPDLYPCL